VELGGGGPGGIGNSTDGVRGDGAGVESRGIPGDGSESSVGRSGGALTGHNLAPHVSSVRASPFFFFRGERVGGWGSLNPEVLLKK